MEQYLIYFYYSKIAPAILCEVNIAIISVSVSYCTPLSWKSFFGHAIGPIDVARRYEFWKRIWNRHGSTSTSIAESLFKIKFVIFFWNEKQKQNVEFMTNKNERNVTTKKIKSYYSLQWLTRGNTRPVG